MKLIIYLTVNDGKANNTEINNSDQNISKLIAPIIISIRGMIS